MIFKSYFEVSFLLLIKILYFIDKLSMCVYTVLITQVQ